MFSLLTDEQKAKLAKLDVKIYTCQELVDHSAKCTATFESLIDQNTDLDKPVIIM